MRDSKYISLYDSEAKIDLKDVLKDMMVMGDFTFHSGKKALLKFDIDKITKERCEDIFEYGLSDYIYHCVPAIIMTGAFRFIKKGQVHIQVYPDNLNFSLYTPYDLEDKNVCIVDDIVTTGKAMDSTQKILENNGFVVKEKVCLLNRGNYKCKSLINREQMMELLGL